MSIVSRLTIRNLPDRYDELVKFVTNLSRSAKYQKTSPPRPLTTNLVDEKVEGTQPETSAARDDTQGTTFSVEEWIMFFRQDEGQRSIAEGHTLPQEGVQPLNAVVKITRITVGPVWVEIGWKTACSLKLKKKMN